MTRSVPHDPAYADLGRTTADGQPCNQNCPGAWPCDERARQRDMLRRVRAVLRGDGWQRAGDVGRFAVWHDDTGRALHVGYGACGLHAELHAGGRVGVLTDVDVLQVVAAVRGTRV